MARTKDAVLAPGQKELMEKEYLDFVKPSTYGNKANPSSCNSLYDDVENPELRAIVEKVAATTPYREETSPNEAQSPPNPLKRISGKQRKATLEEYQQTFLQVPRIDASRKYPRGPASPEWSAGPHRFRAGARQTSGAAYAA